MSTLNDNDKENAKYHYFTASTGTNSIFWAEEGLSTSNKEVNTGWQHANLVRCVRTLASDDGLYEANKFYQYSDNIFTLTGLTATKGTTETIDIHLERDEINGLSSRIQVSKDYLKQKMVDGIIIIIRLRIRKDRNMILVNTIMRIAEKLIKEFGECLIRKNWV